MNFKSKGLIVAILILISLLLVCHISNFLYPKQSKSIYTSNKNQNKNLNSFLNLPLSIPNTPLDTKYNQITYDKPIDPSICKNMHEAEIPCNIISSCSASSQNTVPMTTPYELSESEWAVVYKAIYENAGLDVLRRTLGDKKSNKTTTTVPQ